MVALHVDYLLLTVDICKGCEKGVAFSCSISDVDYQVHPSNISDPLSDHSMARIDISLSTSKQVELLQVNLM